MEFQPAGMKCAQSLRRRGAGEIERQRGTLRSTNLRKTVTASFPILRKLRGHPCPQIKGNKELIRRDNESKGIIESDVVEMKNENHRLIHHF
jgi:hypothetical protein